MANNLAMTCIPPDILGGSRSEEKAGFEKARPRVARPKPHPIADCSARTQKQTTLANAITTQVRTRGCLSFGGHDELEPRDQSDLAFGCRGHTVISEE